jgi:hypothetical protein
MTSDEKNPRMFRTQSQYYDPRTVETVTHLFSTLTPFTLSLLVVASGVRVERKEEAAE